MALNFLVLIVSMTVLTILVSTFKEIILTSNIDTKGETIYYIRKPLKKGRADYFSNQEKQKIKEIEVPAQWCIKSETPFSFHPSKKGNIKDFEGFYVNENYLNLLDLDFIQGGRFTQKHIENNQRVIVISRSAALYTFGTTDVVGKDILINANDHKIVGVYKNMSLGSNNAAMAFLPENLSTWDRTSWDIALLGANLNREALVQKLNKHSDAFFEESTQKFRLISNKGLIDEKLEQFGLILTIILILTLLLPTLLMANIIVTRMETKINELGIRKAFGANRKAIFKQLLTENVVLSMASGIVALLIGQYFAANMIYPEEFYTVNNVLNIPLSTHLVVLLFYILFGIISGIYPSGIVAKKSIISSINSN